MSVSYGDFRWCCAAVFVVELLSLYGDVSVCAGAAFSP